jgi:hypothetical protein
MFPLLLACAFVSCREEPVASRRVHDDLPGPAARFLERHFPGEQARETRRGEGGNTVILDGYELLFSAYGGWRSVIAREGWSVPPTVLSLVSPRISRQVHDHQAGGDIRRLVKTSVGFEVGVSSARASLVFGIDGELVVDGAGWRRPVDVPAAARAFLASCFPGARVISSTSCCDARDVLLDAGVAVLFSPGWEWQVISGVDSDLPASVVELLPVTSATFLAERLPGARVLEIARETDAYVARVVSPLASGDVVFCLSGEWVNAYSAVAAYRLVEEVDVVALPPGALAYALEHFDSDGMAYAEMHADGYVIHGRDGRLVDFTRDGELRGVETSARDGLPPGMIPRATRERVRELFPGRRIVAYYPRSIDSPGGSRVIVSGHPPARVHEFSLEESVSVFWP